MEDETRTRRKKKRRKKKKKGNKFLAGCAIFLLLLLTVAGIVAFFVYRDLRNTTDNMSVEIDRDQHESRNAPVDIDAGEPFSVLVLGIDNDEERDYLVGRSDTMMLMTINPNTERTSIVSIPRDTYTEIIGRGTMDKINHAYAFGEASMSMDTVENLFDVPVDYFVAVNMDSMPQIIDAVGGITVTPNVSFEHSGYHFQQGQSTHVSGSEALAYSRMRYDDPEGDYGRQARQREVIESTLRQIASVDSVMNYRGVLDSLGNTMQTNMTFDEMVDMFRNYNNAVDDIEQVQMSGTGQMIDGVYYEMIPDEEVSRVSNFLKDELELN